MTYLCIKDKRAESTFVCYTKEYTQQLKEQATIKDLSELKIASHQTKPMSDHPFCKASFKYIQTKQCL